VEPDPADALRLDAATRARLWSLVGDAIEAYRAEADGLDVAPLARPEDVRHELDQFDFDRPLPPHKVVEAVVQMMRRLQPHVTNPRHFGLFDPAPTAMGVLGEALAAAFNPCLATWAGSPVGVEVEQLLVHRFGELFGYRPELVDGTFTSGGSEANLTGLLLALTAALPEHRDIGVRGLSTQPVVYLSEQAHPSWLKATRVAGLGGNACRIVRSDSAGRLDASALDQEIAEDRRAGRLPLLIAATAGTTVAGVVDPLSAIATVADRHLVWMHVDAAWGGAAMLLQECRPALDGIDRADSLTFDPHKWLSVPMGCGMVLTRHRGLLQRTFSVAATFLTDDDEPDGQDPSTHSIRWSRNFAGLKLLLSLAVAGWQGYAAVLRRQIALADRLRRGLSCDGWLIRNDTTLPVVCFTPADRPGDVNPIRAIAAALNRSGRARIFQVQVGGQPMLRACITNYATTDADIDQLIEALRAARTSVRAGDLDPSMLVDGEGATSACSTGLAL
jgi:glutamate/tyrosine decarboxylase-like PLP-dependent enzyme